MTTPDWDDDSSRLRANLTQVFESLVADAQKRVKPHVAMARRWHTMTMAGLDPDGRPSLVGKFRGEAGLETIGVEIGGISGARPADVATALGEFEVTFQRVMAQLDALYPIGSEIDLDGVKAVIDVAGWAHAEWVRIHPFANGNGRIARAWANFVLARYGIPPVIGLRPRPRGRYAQACARAMHGDWQLTADALAEVIQENLANDLIGTQSSGDK